MSTSTEVEFTVALDSDAQVDKRVDLNRRFLMAAFADTTLLEDIPRGVMLFLLPDDDPEFVKREVAAAADSARRGQDVYLRHVRVAELPELPEKPGGPPVGLRRTFFDRDGAIARQEVCGPDGAWHAVEPPEPVDD